MRVSSLVVCRYRCRRHCRCRWLGAPQFTFSISTSGATTTAVATDVYTFHFQHLTAL